MTSDVQAFALTIHTGTNAFKPEPTGELVRILREVAEQSEVGREYGKSVPILVNRCRFGGHHPKLTGPGFRTASG